MPEPVSKYTVEGDRVLVRTPYSDRVAEACRAWGGTWDRQRDVWSLPVQRLEAVQARLGKDFTDLVEVEVGYDDWDDYSAQLVVGWHVLAGRRYRDRRADLHATLVQGYVPASGGSMKSPDVRPSADARFRLWVPRDFAQAQSLQVVTDPRAAEDAVARKAADVARVRALMAELNLTPEDLS